MGKLVFLENTKNTNQLLTKSGICKEQIKKVNALIKKIEEQELIISIFGQFKRGKSTFINTILGEDILPMGIVPVTSVVTKIKYGPKRAEICFRDFSKDIPLADLNQYVDERNNPDNNKGVSFVNIFYPCALLEKGITIVDTPGIGSMHKHNSDAAYEFVKESDAVIFMISVDSPINEIESDFLSQIKEYASKIYFAANKIDIVSHTELEEYIIYCQKIISNVMNTQDIKLYPISAKDKMDIGVQRLISDVTTDIEKFGEDILMESVIIKLKDG